MHKIIHGDCLSHLKQLKDASAHIAVTSPPYNIDLEYNSYEDNKDKIDYLDWLSAIFKEIKRVLVDDGSFFLNVGSTNKFPFVAMDVASKVRDDGWVLTNHIVWVKSITIDESNSALRTLLTNAIKKDKIEGEWLDQIKEELEQPIHSYGHFKPINSKRYINHLHEAIFHFTKSGNVNLDRLAIGVPYEHKSNIARWKHTNKADLRCRGNCWFIPYSTVQTKKEKHNHPAGYPVELVENCVRLHGYDENTVVLDPFLGAGTTTVACVKLGCSSIGIELDKTYYDTACSRLQELENGVCDKTPGCSNPH